MNLHQFSLFQIIIGAGVVVGLLAVIQHWALSRLNGDPADELDHNAGDKDAEILGDVPVRSKVGTPRPRRLQPLQTSQEMSLSGTDMPVPADSLAMAGASAFAKPKESSRADQPAPTPRRQGADHRGEGGRKQSVRHSQEDTHFAPAQRVGTRRYHFDQSIHRRDPARRQGTRAGRVAPPLDDHPVTHRQLPM